MANSAEDIYLRWKSKCPVDAPLSDVMKVLEAFFDEIRPGNHIVANHPALRELIPFGITVSTVSGRTVKGYQIKDIVKAVTIIKDSTKRKREKS